MNNSSEQNMEQPLLSIIIPVYNVQDEVGTCLDSILNQSYPNVEVLVINDGSTDKSGEVCDEYARRDSRVRVFHTSNIGVSAARNYLLPRINGEFLTFIDGDDWFENDILEKRSAILD